MMFAEWVTMGVHIGLTVFFGLFTFLLSCMIVLGIIGIIGQIFAHMEDGE